MKAFVIMPYGGADPALAKEFKRVFIFIKNDVSLEKSVRSSFHRDAVD